MGGSRRASREEIFSLRDLRFRKFVHRSGSKYDLMQKEIAVKVAQTYVSAQHLLC